jgi:predicted ABC-type ATPase
LARYPRTLANLTQAVRLADAAVLYDSQDVTLGTHTAVAMCKGTWTKELVQPLLQWAQQVLGTK